MRVSADSCERGLSDSAGRRAAHHPAGGPDGIGPVFDGPITAGLFVNGGIGPVEGGAVTEGGALNGLGSGPAA